MSDNPFSSEPAGGGDGLEDTINRARMPGGKIKEELNHDH